MAGNLSVVQARTGPTWPLGFISVANSGSPVGIMSLVDANNNWSPTASSGNGNVYPEYAIRCRSIWFQGYKPAANNNGMVTNTGNVYIFQPGNGSGNKTDTGCMVGVIPANGGYFNMPLSLGATGIQFNPYEYTIDADVNGEGAIVTLVGPQGN